ncbi:MAG TPA: hypothetical protein VN047_05740 [Sphingopyxis sp.]|uniref:hypothetical protein n=1 Tax=Sphingopyxis sp. TaxID=1908224 RepID=UPI002C58A259|nr:hypothetical protein [Sphingopyxis sp.]HWW56373.1 hypothetical protein [Sphingopyxis sp.]
MAELHTCKPTLGAVVVAGVAAQTDPLALFDGGKAPAFNLAIGATEDMLRGLLRGEHSSLHLSFNDHAANYLDATKERADGDLPDDEWVSESERDKALGLNQVWTLQWYPNSPVGFCRKRASSLDALLSWVAENGRTA